jgi:hypothetical protein
MEKEIEYIITVPTDKGLTEPCDGKCTPDDIREGMFGYICLRCKYSDLGSINDN